MTSRSFRHQELADDPHHREGLRRHDEAWLAAAWADPDTRVLALAGSRVRPVDGALAWLPTSAAPAGERVLLGRYDGRVHFAVLVEPGQAPGEREEWVPLRGVTRALLDDPARAPLVLHAVGLAEWRYHTRFCPRCGHPLEPRASGHELVCTGCGRAQFPRTDPAVIMAVVHGEPGSPDERLLLGRRGSWPQNRFSTLAGFCEPGESVADAVRREVLEEVGIVVDGVDWFDSQGWPFPASLMLGCVAHARSPEPVTDDVEDEIVEWHWFSRDELREGAASGRLALPGGISISRSLVESWAGEPLPGSW